MQKAGSSLQKGGLLVRDGLSHPHTCRDVGGGGLQFSNLASLTHPPVPPLTFKGADWLQENPRQCYQVSRFTSNKSVVLVVLKHVASQWDWLLDGARLALHTTGKKLNSVLDTLLPSLRVSSSPNCVHWL